jgi:hypothetical protein
MKQKKEQSTMKKMLELLEEVGNDHDDEMKLMKIVYV